MFKTISIKPFLCLLAIANGYKISFNLWDKAETLGGEHSKGRCECTDEYNIILQNGFVEAHCGDWDDSGFAWCYLSGGAQGASCPGASKSNNGNFYWTTHFETCQRADQGGPDGSCVDKDPYCADMAQKGDCYYHSEYMLQYCKVSCNSCDTGACGINPAVNRIVNGTEAKPHSIPWIVSFYPYASCGGVLISDRHVLTAAHCHIFSHYKAYISEHDKKDLTDGIAHDICRVEQHHKYNDATDNNDFAIVHLREPVQLNSKASIVCLPTEDMRGDFFDGKRMTVSGWGRTSSGGSSPDELHTVDVFGVTNHNCATAYASPLLNQHPYSPCTNCISSQMLCAGAKDLDSWGNDACQGDSGGPLTYEHRGSNVVVGVVSWGHGCAKKGVPGVYARVTEVMDWINEQLSKGC